MDGMLSQEEINALLNGMNTDTDSATDTSADTTTPEEVNNGNSDNSANEEFLTDIEKDTVGEISNISMGTAATTLSSLVNQKVNISIPVVTYATWDDLVKSYDRPCVFLQIQYKEGLDGNNILILKENDVKIIADLMMGGDGTNTDGEITELHLSAICEAMNQMMGSASTSLSSMLNMKIDISPPTASLVDLNDNLDQNEISDFLSKGFVKNAFKLTIGDLVDSEIMQLFPVEFAKNLCRRFENGSDVETASLPEEPVSEHVIQQDKPHVQQPQQTQQQTQQTMQQSMSGQQMTPPPVNMNQAGYGMPTGYPMGVMGTMPGYNGVPYQQMQPQMMQEVNVQPAQFQAFSNDLAAVTQKENINLIMDVPLEVTVELGRTTKSIKEILEFAPGTIIELDKIAGEPIDVLVNGKYVAKGEVVVIEESFGIRVTEIIK
ncbi:flagellar motor switch phosphatase FliY [Bovifimicola ammoniilytica]|uniref:flagellar motor switch phosphatase FliY n=1 Tax=Bovifimicola ammoniilytica TaxID=2981720 RepID=UPI000820EC23|nr:flagellar motor switch phosphatase FliY [Bovifimicola ammoniilytica]MCU6753215.1 flagellar motor switch phosphatase FliY [Bovifimicola ammoniilytica]SCJ57223.1 Flagellar motor switch protein FliN [uncultured Eubacterium sp.]